MARVSADVNPGSMDVSVGGRGSVLATPKAKWATAHRVTEWENSSGVGWRAASREALNALGGPLICKFKKEYTVGAGCVRCLLEEHNQNHRRISGSSKPSNFEEKPLVR